MSGPLRLVVCCLLLSGCVCRVIKALEHDAKFIGWEGETFDRDRTFSASNVWVETLSWEPRAFLYHNFMTPEECDHLINLANPFMQKSTVIDNASGKPVDSDVRTSRGHFLLRGQDDVVKRIENRIAEFTNLPVEHGESLHILNYQVSQKYSPHYDYFHDKVNVQNGGQRLATMLMYLSDVEEGGETVFPASETRKDTPEHLSSCGQTGLAVKPKKGDALLFYSLRPDGSQDTSSLHTGCPVIKGSKWSATKWIRQRPYAV